MKADSKSDDIGNFRIFWIYCPKSRLTSISATTVSATPMVSRLFNRSPRARIPMVAVNSIPPDQETGKAIKASKWSRAARNIPLPETLQTPIKTP